MAFQDASNMTIAWGDEGTYGTLSGGQYTSLPITGESIEPTVNTERSGQIVSGRQNKAILELGRQVVGAFQSEFSYDAMTTFFLPRGMQSTVETPAVFINGQLISVNFTTKTYTKDASAWSQTPTPGGIYHFSGFTKAGNNGFKRVVSATSNTIVVDDTAGVMTETDTSATGTIRGANLFTGTNTAQDLSFSIEKTYLDPATDVYIHHAGCVFDSLSLNFAANSIATAEFEIRGATTTEDGATDSSPATVATADSEIITPQRVKLYLNGTNVENAEVESFTIAMNHNLRERFRLGSVNLVDYGFGTMDVSGTFRAYFSSNTTLASFLAFTTQELTLVVEDSTGQAVVFNFPAAKFTKHAQLSEGRSTDVFADIAFECGQSAQSQQVAVSYMPSTP